MSKLPAQNTPLLAKSAFESQLLSLENVVDLTGMVWSEETSGKKFIPRSKYSYAYSPLSVRVNLMLLVCGFPGSRLPAKVDVPALLVPSFLTCRTLFLSSLIPTKPTISST